MFTPPNGKSVLWFCFLFALAYADKGCDKLKCKGPLRIYEELGCEPVYASSDECCAVSYDCSHLDGRSADKCYANGREYAVGEMLVSEANDDPCIAGCQCTAAGRFNCTYVEVKLPELPRPDCFRRYTSDSCPAKVECPKEGEERAKCEFQGKTYLDGESFSPQKRQDLRCECNAGFTGELTEPFCSRRSCAIERDDYPEIRKNCAPIYYEDRLPQLSCASYYKCHEDVDQIIPAEIKNSSTQSAQATELTISDLKCKYGDLLLRPNDKVKRNYFNLRCASCECEVPPFMTCRQIPFSECELRPTLSV